MANQRYRRGYQKVNFILSCGDLLGWKKINELRQVQSKSVKITLTRWRGMISDDDKWELNNQYHQCFPRRKLDLFDL